MAKRKTAATPPETKPSFEEAIARLEEIVRELEEADLPLEKSLAVFEEGVRLSRLLHERLNEAERKVEILLKNEEGGATAVPFRAGGGEEAEGAAEEGGAADDADDVDDADESGGGEDGKGNGGGPGQTGFRF